MSQEYFPLNPIKKKVLANRYFDTQESTLKEQFHGFCITSRFYTLEDVQDQTFADKSRYLVVGHGDDLGKLLIIPLIAGAFGSFISIMMFLMWPFLEGDDPYPFEFALAVLCWNLFWLNVHPFISKYTSQRYMTFDRKRQQVSIRKTVADKDVERRDEYGNPCFHWKDVVCCWKGVPNGRGATVYVPIIKHINYKQYPWFRVRVDVAESVACAGVVAEFWERIVRFMEKDKPLPDIPEFEKYRHLCPVTVEFDKQNNRPSNYWNEMGTKQQKQIKLECMNERLAFHWDPDSPNEEIIRPWERWPIDESLKDKMDYKRKLKIIALQLCLGLPYAK
ncbi:hypothetical protein [Flocculibacter collagenilyticus]|uniref:hypothetical protein n=1 Tax=Flocculibacter collagenilyticus TaxID=2744479 RepID=UPI0018F7B14A|nr:hypothetical protein [Flocculibacter collagenilyticus]